MKISKLGLALVACHGVLIAIWVSDMDFMCHIGFPCILAGVFPGVAWAFLPSLGFDSESTIGLILLFLIISIILYFIGWASSAILTKIYKMAQGTIQS